MAAYACGRCGATGDAQPCASCGAPAFDVATELPALRFTLSRRAQLRAGLGAGLGALIGFVHSEWLQGITRDNHYTVMIAWVFALAALGMLLRPRAIAALEEEVASRAGRASRVRNANLLTLAVGLLVIVADTALVLHWQAATMSRQDGERIVVQRTCELAETCSKGVLCIGAKLSIDLELGHARVDKSDVDDCLAALDSLARTHTACTAPPPPACAAISRTTIPRLLDEAHALTREIDRAIDDQLRKGLR